MTQSQTEVKELCRKIYPGGDNHFAQPVKGGKWRIGYTNDYPMQHGSGEEIVLPEQVVKMLLSNPESPADSIPDQDALWEEFRQKFKEIEWLSDMDEPTKSENLELQLKDQYIIKRKP